MQQKNKCNIFGTRIDNLSKTKILDRVVKYINGSQFYSITTLNPEILLKTREDLEYQKIINNSSLNIADGIGIKFALWRYGCKLKVRYTGIDLMWDILKIADENNSSIFLVANNEGLSSWQETRDAIKKIYPNLKIKGKNISCHYKFNDDIKDYQLLITNFGAPYQEQLINQFKNKNTSLRLGIGVGGAFDYITKNIKRAPKWMQKIGLEWLYRLSQQPNRISRIFRAVIVFPLTIIFTRKK